MEGLRVTRIIKQYLARRKRQILARLDKAKFEGAGPVLSGAHIHYEVAKRTHGMACEGTGMIRDMVRRLGLPQMINRSVPAFKRYLPYSESDHVLNIAYNLLAGGTSLDHLEWRRNDEVYLDALGVRRISDPTTAGDFCRRFDPPITPSNRLSSNVNMKTFASRRSTSPSSPIARHNVVLRIVSWSCGKISKGLVRVVVTGQSTVEGETCTREATLVADGLRNLPPRIPGHPGADCEDGAKDRVSPVGLEPLARVILPPGRSLTNAPIRVTSHP
jgi:hypothetical protein